MSGLKGELEDKNFPRSWVWIFKSPLTICIHIEPIQHKSTTRTAFFLVLTTYFSRPFFSHRHHNEDIKKAPLTISASKNPALLTSHKFRRTPSKDYRRALIGLRRGNKEITTVTLTFFGALAVRSYLIWGFIGRPRDGWRCIHWTTSSICHSFHGIYEAIHQSGSRPCQAGGGCKVESENLPSDKRLRFVHRESRVGVSVSFQNAACEGQNGWTVIENVLKTLGIGIKTSKAFPDTQWLRYRTYL